MQALTIGIITLALVGCAASPERLRARAADASSPQLCAAQMLSNKQAERQIAGEEIARRGYDCQANAALVNAYIQTKLQADAANQVMYQQMLEAAKQASQRPYIATQSPPAPSEPQSVQCTSQNLGYGTVKTTCN
jgi:hypothetical protein